MSYSGQICSLAKILFVLTFDDNFDYVPDVGLEQEGHEGRNSYDFALKSNSTACKILPVRLNATFYYPGRPPTSNRKCM